MVVTLDVAAITAAGGLRPVAPLQASIDLDMTKHQIAACCLHGGFGAHLTDWPNSVRLSTIERVAASAEVERSEHRREIQCKAIAEPERGDARLVR